MAEKPIENGEKAEGSVPSALGNLRRTLATG